MMLPFVYAFLLLVSLALTASDDLIRLGEGNHCIKNLLSSLPASSRCQSMDDAQKSEVVST